MCFYRQTLLSVCLILPWGVFAQPIAQDDLATTDEDTNVVFNIVSNDSGGSFDIDPATVDLDVSSPSTNENTFNAPEGVFSVNPLGEVTFDPADNFFGQAILPYTVKNTNPSPETTGATITVTVTSVNDVLSITSIANQIVNEDGQTSVLGFTINDVETDPDDLDVTALSDNPSLVGNINIDLAGAGINRTIQVTPIADQSGVANITITVDDGTDTNEITFALTVNPINDLPTITSIANQSISQDGQTGLLNFTIGDIETAVGSLSVTGSSDNLALVPDANIDVVGNTADRTVQVTPLAAQNGVATITLVVSDGTDVSQTTFELTVTAPNTPPTITPIANQTIDEDTQTAFLDFTVGDGENPGPLQVTGTSDNIGLVPIANIELAGTGTDRTVRITPLTNQSGIANITLTVDNGSATAQTSFQVTVTAVNDVPTITAVANQNINEDAQTGALNFTINDIETVAGSLSVTRSTDNAALIPLANVVLGGSDANRTVNVTPLANQSGSATITLTVSDGVANISTNFLVTVTAVNDLPTITTVANQNINEDNQTGALNFTIGDVETPIGSLSVTRSTDNAALIPLANVVLGGSGANRTVNVTPLADQSGAATITLTVSDGIANTSTNFQVTVNAVDDTPTISAIGDQSIPENTQTGPLPFYINDVETSATLLTLTPLSSNTALVTNANVVLGGSGSLRNVNVIPSINQIGMTTITLTVSDGANSALTAFQVMVTAVDDPPTITPISNQTIDEDTSTGVLAFTVGDIDTGPGSVTPTGSSSNQGLIPDGNIIFGGSDADRTVQVTPLPNQNGVATITITVSDGVETSFITFDVTVTAVNDAPTITVISDQVVNEDTPTGAIGFTVGDVETAAGSLTPSGTSNNTTLVPNGNIVFGGSGASRTVTVTPALNQTGVATITVNISDGAILTPETFLVTVNAVNDPPTITAISDQVINEDAATAALAFTVGDAETAAGSLTPSGSSNNTALIPNLNITFGGSGASRTVTVTPAPNQFGVATITVNVSDGTNSTPETFLVTVNSVNDPPTITSIGNQSINEDAPTGTGILAFTVGDVETPAGSLTVTRTSSNLVLMPLANVVLGGSGAGRTVIATPAANQFGTTTITLTVSDGTTTVNTNFDVTVASVNDDPTITLITDQIINENTSTGALPFTIGDVETPVGSLSVTRASSNTTLVPLANVVLGGSGANQSVTVTPAPNLFGVTTITITVGDGTSTAQTSFQVTVNAVNDPPTITPIADQVVNEDASTAALAFTIGDPETAAGSLTVGGSSNNTTLVPNLNITFGGSGSSRTVTVTPAPNLSGVATITVNVSDGVNTVPETFLLTVNAVNDAPTISAISDQNINEDAAGGTGILPFTVGDVETAATSLSVSRTSSNLVLVPLANVVLGGTDANRTVTVNPAANQFGSSTITLTVSDGTTTTNSVFVVNVASVNDIPTITVIADQVINESTATGALNFTVGDVETPAGSLALTKASSNTTLVPVANIVFGGSGSSRTVTVTPAPGQFGVATITVTVGDGTATSQTSFELTVNAVNDPPTITAIGDQVINEDFSTGALAFTIGDPETAAGSLVLSAVSTNTTLVPIGNVTFGGSGASRTVTVTPVLNQSGVTTITVNVSDGVNTIPETFIVTVNPVNDAPTVTAIANQTINEDAQTGSLVFTIGDAETPAASLILSSGSSNTTLVPDANIILGGTGPSRTVNVIPVANLSGVTTITINVSDGVISTPLVFQVTVNAANDPPTITAIANQTVAEDTPTGALPFTIGDLDTPVGSLVITPSSSNTTLVPIANIVIGGSGASRTVTVTPANNQTGVTTITLTVSDGTVTTATDFDVTVTPVNDPPTITTITDRTINEDSQTGTINFTIGDAETAASSLVVTGTSSNTTLVPNGNIVLGGSGTSRTVIVIPAANQFGTTTITLSVNDGTTSVSTVFVVNVTAINDGPLITAQTPMPISIAEVQPVVLALSHLTVVDPDDVYPTDFSLFVLGGANYSVVGTTVTPVPNFSGTLVVPVFVNDGALSSPFFNVMIAVASTNDSPVITGQQALAMNEDQTIALSLANLTVTDPDNVYPADFTLTVLAGANYTFTGTTVTPALNFNGTLVVKVKVNDGLADSPTFDLQITVNPVNDPPVITAQSPLSTNEDVAITLVIGNFTVTDPEPTTYTLVVSQVAGANYTVSGNTITPNLNYTGTLTVPVTVSDGFLSSASYNATITVVPANDPPVITGQVSLSTIEDIPLTVKLSDLTVTDVDNPYPTGFSLAVLAGTNYTFVGTTITPVLDFVGTLTVNVRVNDGLANSATYPLQVQVTSEADVPKITGQNPVSMNEDDVRTITIADLTVTDPDTPIGQITVSILPGTNYTFTGNVVTPIVNFFGTLTVNVTVNDGESTSNTFPLQVSVISINDPPTFNNITNVVLLEDAAQQTLTITGISPGPLETQLLLLSVTSDNTALIPQPTQTPSYNGSAATAVISFKPEPNAFGVATITVEVTDPDFAKHTVTFTITVNSVNDAPTLNAITVAPILEDAPEQIIALSGISPGGGLAESGQALSFIPSTDKPELFEVLAVDYNNGQATGTLRIKPKPNANGTAQITLRLQDDGSNSPPNVNFVLRTFTLVTTAVNDLPVITSDPSHIAEPGQVYQYAIVVTDVEGEVITLTVPTKPAWLTLTPGTNGKATLSGTPPNGTTGNFDVLIEAKDPSGTPVQQPYTLTVNSRPVLSPVTISVDEDLARKLTVDHFAPGFADADGNSLAELEITKLPTRGTLTLGSTVITLQLLPFKIAAEDLTSLNSMLNYTPDPDSTGRDTLRWNASDGFMSYSLTDTYAVLNVSTTNDPPVISVLETDTLEYELGSEVPVFLTTTFDGYDPDDDNITSAEIGFKRIDDFKYRPENDRLIFPGSPKITGTFDEDAGILALSGTATAKEYVEAIRSIKYNYTEAKDLLLDSRSVYFSLSDGQTVSLQKSRIITLIYTFSDLDIPTAFTPNGDKANEKWVISAPNGTEQYSDAELKVYNKRGLLVFKSTGLETPWDGIWNGEVLPSDVYFYTIELNYNKVKYKGTVTILR